MAQEIEEVVHVSIAEKYTALFLIALIWAGKVAHQFHALFLSVKNVEMIAIIQ